VHIGRSAKVFGARHSTENELSRENESILEELDQDRVTEIETSQTIAPPPMGYLMGSLFALFGLVVVGGFALAAMLGVAALLHHLNPTRQFNKFHALHEPLVLGLLLAVSVVFVLPPHPWSGKPQSSKIDDSENSGEVMVID
jgi:hypothetical protein